MVVSLLPFPRVVVTVAQLLYPLTQIADKAQSNSLGRVDYAQWMVYMMICAFWIFVERNVLWLVVEYLPLFMEIKLCFFLWLSHPTYKGAAYLWYGHIQPIHKKLDDEYYERIAGLLSKVKIPEAAKPRQGVAGRDMNEEVNKLIEESAKKASESMGNAKAD